MAGAFRLLWVAPEDAELFAGDVPWQADKMAPGEKGEDDSGEAFTAIFLVSSFGFSSSPGEWTAFGRATEEWHRAFRPDDRRRDGEVGFDSKILVNVLVDGLAPVGLVRGL